MTVITLESDNGHSPPIFGICNRRTLQKLGKKLERDQGLGDLVREFSQRWIIFPNL